MSYVWTLDQNTRVDVLPPGTEIEGDEDKGTEDWTVPEGQVALRFRQYYSITIRGRKIVSDSELFIVAGEPKQLWNALGRAQAAIPE